MLKILFHRQTLAILGIHCFGDQAAEIIHIGQAIMEQKAKAIPCGIFCQHHLQLPHHGGSLSSGGIKWFKSFVIYLYKCTRMLGKNGAGSIFDRPFLSGSPLRWL